YPTTPGILPDYPFPFLHALLPLQLLLERVEEAAVGALGNDLLWRALDQADLMQAQRIEAYGVLGIILPPAIIGDLLHRLQGVIVARGEALLHEELRRAVRCEGTDVGRFQDGAQRALGGDGILPDKLPVAGDN